MYIKKYWGNYIGDTDDSLTLMDYLQAKQKAEISLEEIFSDLGLDKLHGNFQEHEEPLIFSNSEGWEMEFYFAIDLIADLAALLLECKMNGCIDLSEFCDELENDVSHICITATPKEYELINEALRDFIAAPLTYDISEMESEEETMGLAAVCETLREELFQTVI